MRPTITLIILTLLTLGGCSGSLVNKIQIPECPGEYKIVQVLNGTISGQDLENLIDNVTEDRLCIARLKALLGDPKIKKLLKKLPQDTQQRVQAIIQTKE